MNEWLKVDNNQKEAVYKQVAAFNGLPPHAIEKDFWVTLLLQSIFELQYAHLFVFKGGTSLSKGWNLIHRFSEDLDFAIDRKAFGFEGHLGSHQRTKLRKTIRSFVSDTFTPALSYHLQEKGAEVDVNVEENKDSDADPTVVKIAYSSIADFTEYLPSRIILEINARSLFEPFDYRNITPFIGYLFPRFDIHQDDIAIPCVIAERTFLEKIFLLHEEFQKKSQNIRTERLTRHMYDLEKMMDTEHAESALANKKLYSDVLQNRKHLTKISGIDYDTHSPGGINLLPPEELIKQWEHDYRNLKESMIYGEALSFEDLMGRMKELMDRINQLSFDS